MADQRHDQLITFSEAALIVPRDMLRHAVDRRKLTLYRRGRTLLVERSEAMALREQVSSPPSRDLSILTEQ